MTNARETPTPGRDPDSIDPVPDEHPDRDRDLSNEPLPVPDADPGVGLAQKGTDEDAVLRREVEI